MSAPDPIASQALWERAVTLAERGKGSVSPNPMVGAVVVRDGEVIGEGWHARYGDLHAERAALADVRRRGHDPAGASMYVTLEPCAHTGRQPPCTEAIVEAGLAEVVVGSDDPSEKADGLGTRLLREAGVEVTQGPPEVAERLRELNQPFRKHSRTGRPWLLLKLAASLDGKVATRTGDSRWISGERSRAVVHAWRAELDAVAVGSGTVAADDPRLTVRDVEGRQPTRVVFDSRASLPSGAALFEDIDRAPLVVVCGPGAPEADTARLEGLGAKVLVAEGGDPASRFLSGMEALGRERLTSVLLEGGPTLAGAALDSGEVDRVELFTAPVLLGGGRPMTEGLGPERLADAVRPLEVVSSAVGQDVRMSCKVKDW